MTSVCKGCEEATATEEGLCASCFDALQEDAYEQVVEAAWHMASQWTRPSVLFRPHMAKDGNQWSALLGDNIQEGVCGFGDTPEAAMLDFDQNWHHERILTVPS